MEIVFGWKTVKITVDFFTNFK